MNKKSIKSSSIELKGKPAARIILLSVVFILTFLFFSHKIIFVTADLGRHIKNGEMFFENHKPISTNFYSYTEPGFKTINHHWGSGVVFYLVQKIFGFKGLSVFFSLISALTILLMFLIAERKSHTYVAFFMFALCVPLIADRIEIRPEMFSMLLLSIYYFLLESYRVGKIAFKVLLFIILFFQLLWVNLHIFFIMGVMLIGIYGINDLINKKENSIKNYSILLVATLFACFLNPFGFEGVLTPLTIFKNYGYMIAENQSVFFMQERFDYTQYIHFEVLMVAAVLITGVVIFRSKIKDIIPELLLLIVFGFLGFRAIRGIPIMCLFLVPVFSFFLYKLITIQRAASLNNFNKASLLIGSVICLLFILNSDNGNSNYLSPLGKYKGTNGLGLFEPYQKSAFFYKQLNISGPIFNNYDIGGYLIYHLFPNEKVFVDNRPEAYSVDFFEKIYNPMLEKEAVWIKMDSVYNFNSIFFYRQDQTPFGQPFLIRRVNDRKNWAPIFVDDVAIIFVKRVEKNKTIIDQYELPPEIFNAVPTK